MLRYFFYWKTFFAVVSFSVDLPIFIYLPNIISVSMHLFHKWILGFYLSFFAVVFFIRKTGRKYFFRLESLVNYINIQWVEAIRYHPLIFSLYWKFKFETWNNICKTKWNFNAFYQSMTGIISFWLWRKVPLLYHNSHGLFDLIFPFDFSPCFFVQFFVLISLIIIIPIHQSSSQSINHCPIFIKLLCHFL